jgi:hypothetical protein
MIADIGAGTGALLGPIGSAAPAAWVVAHAISDRLRLAVPGGKPHLGWQGGCCPGDDPPLLLPLGVARRHCMSGRRVGPGGQFCPQPVSDAEQGLDDQVRKVMDDVNGAAPADVAGR